MVLIVSSTTRLLRGRFTFTSEGTKLERDRRGLSPC